MKDNKKKKIMIMVVGILVLLVALATATYAWFSATSNTEEKNITTAKEELIVTPSSDPIHVENIKPTKIASNSIMDDEYFDYISPNIVNDKNKDAVSIPITVTSKSTINISYNLTIKTDNLNLTEGLNGGTTEDIKWSLHKLSDINGNSSDIVGFGDFYDPKVEQNMIENIEIKPEEKHYYTLYIYIQEMEEDQNKLQGIEFDVIINGNTKKRKIPVGERLSDVLLKNDIIKDRKPNYKTIGCYEDGSCFTDNGLFKLENGKGYVYRRGKYWMNQVKFGRYKANDNIFNLSTSSDGSPINWDILRINEDGSIVLKLSKDPKIAYNWETTNGKPDYYGSNIQQELEKWYENTFTPEEKEMIMETTYCNDRSDNYDGVNKRLNKETPEPTLDCEEKDKVTAKIALPTADELVMIGSNYVNKGVVSSYSEIYLNQKILTMSPSSQDSIYNATLPSHGLYSSNLSTLDKYIVPVITLKPEVTISESVTWKDKIIKTSFGGLQNIYVVGFDE